MEGIKTGRFWHFTILLGVGIFYDLYMASVYKTIAEDHIHDHTLTLAGSFGSICNGCSRIGWASL